jgi:hypothetical protein
MNKTTKFPASTKNNSSIEAWTHDFDFDDFFEMYGIYDSDITVTRSRAKEAAKTIHYKIIISIILNCLSNTPLKEDSILQDFLGEAAENETYRQDLSPIRQQIVNIQFLYNTLQKWQSASSAGFSSPISIYRGFNKQRYHQLFKLQITKTKNTLQTIRRGEIITIPTFLSTSVVRNTALRFVSSGYYFWEIIIPEDKLNRFKYIYLGDEVNLDEASLKESEILLNMGTQLKFLGQATKDLPFIVPTIHGSDKKTVKCIVQRFEFVGYNNNMDLSYLDNCLQGALGNPTKDTEYSKVAGYSKQKRKNTDHDHGQETNKQKTSMDTISLQGSHGSKKKKKKGSGKKGSGKKKKGSGKKKKGSGKKGSGKKKKKGSGKKNMK